MDREHLTGHLAMLFTVLVWGTTFVSTRILLDDFRPVEVLVFRFILGSLALCLVRPAWPSLLEWRREGIFAAAGLCGVCLYFLLENIALTFTLTSNVGVIVSVTPMFTALLSRCILKEDGALTPRFLAGFVVAMTGIGLINLNGARLELHPMGDILALGAAFAWACYSILTRRIGAFGMDAVSATRRVFLHGLLWMIPAALVLGFAPDATRLARPGVIGNLLFLGVGASAICFATWTYAVRVLGAVRTNVWIYGVPVVSVLAGAIILDEPITPLAAAGTALTLLGLCVSQTGRPRG